MARCRALGACRRGASARDGGARGRKLGTGARDLTELVDVPLAGDLRITYHFPAYTHAEARVVEGGDGSISAVVGTEVELEATADEDARAATVNLDAANDKAPAFEVPMQVSGRKLHA